ncbi:MAG: VWA domain-containing protein [Gammaproteobacteria bacterium]
MSKVDDPQFKSIEDSAIQRTLELCRLARDAQLPVTQGRLIDVFRALRNIDWTNEDDFRLALRTNLVANRQDEIAFDRIFHSYWHPNSNEEGDYKSWKPELVRGQKTYGEKRGHEDIVTESEHYGAEEVLRQLNLTDRWDESAPPLAQVIRELAKRLATRPSRRQKNATNGRRIDLRGSVRRNVGNGMELLQLSKVKRRVRRTRIVLLADVSGSMDTFNPFLLQLMLGLQQELKNSRTLVFSTQVSEITAQLRRSTLKDTLQDVSGTVKHWSGGTDIGTALRDLNVGILREGSSHSTVLIIISDGYDNGTIEKIEQEMRAARRRVKTIVWINPMYGASSFEVRAGGLKAALPFVDHFLPAFNAKSLKILVQELALI